MFTATGRITLYVVAFGLSASAVVACRDDAARAHAPADAIPAKVTVQGGQVEVGTAMTLPRANVDVGAFDISATPTTVAQYRRCVSAGVCSAPSVTLGTCATGRGVDGATYSDDSADDKLPLTCASAEQAKQFCDWVGGRLPHLDEWLLAARGTTTRRFSWGNAPSTCDVIARRAFFATEPALCCDPQCDGQNTIVGQHVAGAGPSGLQDALLTRGELLAAQESSVFTACAAPNEVCAVIGLVPGGIDNVIGAPTSEKTLAIAPNMTALGFRCVWEGAGQ